MSKDLESLFPTLAPPPGGLDRLSLSLRQSAGVSRPRRAVAVAGAAVGAAAVCALAFIALVSPGLGPPPGLDALEAALRAPPEARAGEFALRALPSSNPRVRIYVLDAVGDEAR